MRKPWPFALVLALFPACAWAQTITVRSGEHDGFSRLVFRLPEELGWRMGRTSDGYVLRFASSLDGIVTRDVFTYIPRDRIAGLTVDADAGQVAIVLGCACHATAFLYQETRLVIDVADGPPEPGSPFEEPLDSPDSDATASEASVLPIVFDSPKAGTEDAIALPNDAPGPPELPPLDQLQQRHMRVTAAQAALLDQIGRAASQGLLTPNVDMSAEIRPAAEAEPASVRPGSGGEAAATDPADHISLQAASRIDLDASDPPGPEGKRTFEGDVCIPDNRLDIAGWGAETGFASGLGTLRRALVEEFDQTREQAAVDLARFYVHFGFGAEAMRSLEMAGEAEPAAPLLRSMARIMDNGMDPGLSPFSEQLACDGAAALWAALAYSSLPPGQPVNRNAVLRSFNALPSHLKGWLGPGLADRFVAAGDTETGALILKNIGRHPGDSVARLALSQARHDAATGKADQADATLARIAQGPERTSAEALVTLIRSRVAGGEPVPPDMAVLAGALAQEYEQTATGRDLAESEVLALAASGQFAKARSGFNQLDPGSENREQTRETIVDLLIRSAPDDEFLNQAADPYLTVIRQTSEATRLRAAERFLELGFPTLALSLDVGAAAPAPEAALVHGRAAVALGRHAEAIAELASVQSDAADALRAEAYQALGAHDRAMELFRRIGDGDAARTSAVLGSAWDALEQSDLAEASALARIMRGDSAGMERATPPPDLGTEGGPLTGARTLLAASMDLRNGAETVLNGFAVPSANAP